MAQNFLTSSRHGTAGIAHIKAGAAKVYLGRKPSYTEAQVSEVVALKGEGKGISAVARQVGLSRAAIYRLLKNPAEAYASLRAWN